MRILLIISTILTVFVSVAVPCRGQALPLRSYTTQNGLASAQVNTIGQDHHGYLWFGCTGGMSRFNGISFQTYRQTEGLPHESCLRIAVDRAGTVWVRTLTGLAYFDAVQDRFVPCGPESEIIDIAPWQDGLAVLTRDRELFSGNRSQLWTSHKLPDDREWASLANHQGRLFLSDRQYGIVELQDTGVTSILQQPGIASLVSASEWLLLITPTRLYAFDPVSGQTRAASPELGSRELIRSATIMPDETVWIGTNTGAYRIQNNQIERFDETSGIPGIPVWTMLQDRDGILWLGANHGVGKLPSQDLRVYSELDHAPATSVICFAEEPDGDGLFIGSTAGLFRLDNTGRVSRLPYPYFQQYPPWAVVSDGAGGHWVGTEGGGAVHVHDNRLDIFTRANGTLPCDNVTDLKLKPDGTLLVACKEGLAIRKPDGTWQSMTGGDGLPVSYVRCMLDQPDGSTLLGTLGAGVLRYDGHRLVPVTPDREELAAVYDMVQFGGKLWMATNYGVASLDKDGNTTIYGREAGLPNASTTALLPAGDFLWIATDGGAALLDPEPGRVVRILTADEGLPGNEFTTHNALFQDQEGNIWFGVFGGAASLAPQTGPVEPRKGRPGLLIHEVAYRVGDTEFLEHVTNGDAITIPANARGITFRFDVVWFQNENSIHIRSRLAHLEQQWMDVLNPSRLESRYPTIPFGDYTFQVRVDSFTTSFQALEQGLLSISIPRPWTMSPVTWATGLLVFLLLVAGGNRWWNRQLQRDRDKLNRLVRQQTLELEKTNHILAMKNVALQQMAETDELTGLYNRRFFMMALRQHIQLTRRGGGHDPLSIIILDVDHFKTINDRFGHDVGDLILRQVAKCLKAASRNTDILARFGGEEFILLLPKTDLPGARTAAEKIRKALAAHTFNGDGFQDLNLTVSLGISQLRKDIDEITTATTLLIKTADICLYQAKEKGRNCICASDEIQT